MSTQIELMQRMNALMQQQLEKLTALEQRLGGQSGAYSQLQESASGAAESLNETTSAIDAANAASEKSEGLFGNLVSTVKEWNKSISDSLTKALGPFSEGLQLLGVNFESLTNIISNPLGAAFGFLRQGYDILIEKAAELIQKQYEFANALEKVRDKFGSFNENTSRRIKTGYQQFSGALRDAAGNSKAFASKFQMGIDGAIEQLEKISELAGDLGPIFDTLGQQFNNATAELYVLKDGLHFTEEGLQQTARLAMLSGKSLKSFSQEIMASVDKIGRNFGISTKVLGADVSKALSNFKMLGKMTGDYVKQITQAAVFTRKLGFELTELTGLVDKFDDFEQGAEAAASLAQGFGLVLDPLKMMNMQDPAARLQEVQRAFLATGKSVESMTRQERALLASTSGLDEKILTQALSAKGLTQSYDEIAAGADAASKKQRSTEQVMTDLADNIENVITPFEKFTGFVDAFFKGIARGFGLSKGFQELLGPLASGMLNVANIGVGVGKMLAGFLFPKRVPTREDPEGLVGIITNIKNMFEGIATAISEFTAAVTSGKDVPEAIEKLFTGVFSNISGAFSESTTGFDLGRIVSSLGATLLNILNGTIKFLAKQIPKWTQSLTEMFKDTGPGGVTGGVKSAFGTALDSLIDTLKSTDWAALLEALGEALIGAMGRFFDTFPIATLFVTGGPILTVIGDFVNQFFGKIGDVFSGVGSSGSLISSDTAGKVSGGISDGVTSSAAQVVESSQGLLDRIFNLIEQPAKIALMASVIADAIRVLGSAIRDVLLSFMEPLPGRGDGKTFIDIVVDSAKKFEGVSWQNLMTLGAVLGAVGLGIGAVMFAVSKLASSIGTMGAVGLLVGGGVIAGGLALLPTSAGAKGLLGGLLGGIGDLMIDITTPFTNPKFTGALAAMGTLGPQLLSLVNVAGTLKSLVTAIVEINGALPKKGFWSGGGNDIQGLRTTILDVITLLAGDETSTGIATELQKIPAMTNAAGALAAATGTANVLTQVVKIVSSLGSLGDIETASDKVKEMAGTDKFIEQLQTLSTSLVFMTPSTGAEEALKSMITVLTQVGAAAATINGLGSTEDGWFSTGLTTKTKNLADFMPTFKTAIDAMKTNIIGIEGIDSTKPVAGIESIFRVLDVYSEKLAFATTNLSQDKLDAFEDRVTAIVNHTKTVRSILENLATIPLDATIDRMERDMKVAKTTMSINGGAVNVNVVMNVTMNAEKMAGSLVMGGFVKPSDSFKKYMQDNDGVGEQFESPYDDGYKWGQGRGIPTNTGYNSVTGGSS